MKPCAVLFDVDGTLALSEETHHRALDDVLHDLGIAKPDHFDVDMTGQSMCAAYETLKAKTALRLSYAELAAAKYRAFLVRIQELRWRPAAQDAMQLARDVGCRIGIVTNSDRILLDATLRHLGIQLPDQITVSRNDVRQGKPDAEPYLRAAWLLDVPPEHCIVVEDSFAGASAGVAAGMRVIGWPERMSHIHFPPRAAVADSADVRPVLQAAIESLLSR